MAQKNPRQYHTQQVPYLRKTVNFNTPGIATGVLMGTIPAGSQIVNCLVNVVTAFNAASTNVLTVGYGASLNEIVAAGDVDESAAEAHVVLTGLDLEFASDTDISIKFTESGDAATTGQAIVIIMYVPNNDG